MSSPVASESAGVDALETLSAAVSPHDRPSSTGPPDAISSQNRNNAPGISDRRKSVRPSGSSARGRGGSLARRARGVKSAAGSRLAMAGADDETQGENEDQFEDAFATPQPLSPNHAALTPNGQAADPNGKSTSNPKVSHAVSRSFSGGDDMAYMMAKDGTVASAQEARQAAMAAGNEASNSNSNSQDERQSNGMKRLSLLEGSTRLSPEPTASSRERARSRSPARFPVKSSEASQPGHAPSESASQPPPSLGERIPTLEPASTPTTRQQSSSPPRQRPGIGQKVSSGLGGFLGRAMSIRKPAKSPTPARQEGRFAAQRRGPHQSVPSADGGANGVARIAEGDDLGSASLKDQFQRLKLQTEHETLVGLNGPGSDADDDKTPVAQRSSNAGLESPLSPSRRGSENWPRKQSISSISKGPTNGSTLPPGTASGLDAGPSDEPTPVNWDLWQKVVFEGPAAVQKTSGEELSRALAGGIPPTIRGVVWQALAESKDEYLEGRYKVFRNRGGADEEPPVSRADTEASGNGTLHEETSVVSSRASVRSDPSTPATSNLASPQHSTDGAAAEGYFAEQMKRDRANITKLEKAIKRDLGSRTSYSKFTQSAGLQDGLFGVCKAFALFDEAVGYAQGINFVAMPLLFNMSEEEAFAVLVQLMHKYDLRSLFTTDMPGLHRRLYQFERLLEEHEPALYCHLRRRNVHPQLYATQWFLTLFAYRFPLQLVLRVYDLIFSEGLTAILKFGIVLMQRNRDALLAMKDMSHLTNFLKEKIFDVYIDKSPSASSLLDSGFFGSVTGGADKELYRADEMVRDACGVTVSEEQLQAYTAEWEETQRVAREREAELENVRAGNVTLTAQVKTLEERIQQHDAEHVNIAGDLVRTKVENNELLDENEGLKMKIEELKKVVDVQPAEVEERLQSEMERIMQRNIEVQNENRSLKDEMDEIEQELVKVKMAHAELRGDHDTLKQKWSNLQSLLTDKH